MHSLRGLCKCVGIFLMFFCHHGYAVPTSVPDICKTYGANSLPSSAYKNGNMWGLFKLARRVEQGAKWHPANDNLRGTDKYGKPPTDPRTGPTGTMEWKYNQVQYFMFSTGDFSEWMIMKRNVIDTKFGGPKDQEVLCSSDSKTPKNYKQYYRSESNEDPWLSYLDHGTSSMMYGEAGIPWHTENVKKGGMNVWIYPTTTTTTHTTPTTTPSAAKSACGLTEWDLSEGELTGTSVSLGTSGGASAAVTITTAHQFAKCTVPGDFKFALYEVDTANGICSTTAVAAGLWTTKKVFEPTPGTNAATSTARVDIAFSTTALAADLQKATPQIYRKGNTAGTEILSFCVRSAIKVDDYELRFSEMIVTATINTVLAIPAIENVAVTRLKAKDATTDVDVLGTVNAYECYKDGNTFKGWLPGASKPALTTQNNILSVCVTGVSTAVECKEFWDLSLKQGSKADDVRVDDGANKKRLITSVFGVQAIKDTNQVDYKGCAAQLMLDASYFDSAKPEKVTLSGSVRMGLAARRRLLRDSRSLSDDAETADFDVDVDRLQGSTSGVTMTSLVTTVLVSAATVCIM